jgi:peroxiredoxin
VSEITLSAHTSISAIISYSDTQNGSLRKLRRAILQAEIAGRTIPSADGYPAEGHIIRDFCMCSSEGQEVLLSEYRGHCNVVLVFTGESDSAAELLSELRRHQRDLAENETRALALVAGSQQRASELKHALHLNFEVLVDVDGSVHRSMGVEDQLGHLLPAVFVTDRFGEVFAAYKAGQGKSLPGVKEILGWIEFINRQCPECGPLEWPD